MPKVMQKMMKSKVQGVRDRQGFYDYDEKSAKAWEQAWVDFTYDIRRLVKKYERRIKREGRQ